MMNKRVKIVMNILSLIVLVSLMAFQNISSKDIKVKTLDISITDANDQYFIYEEEIRAFIHSLQDSLFNEPLKEINISMLEDTLQSLTYVANAEVFSTLDGTLSVVLKQNNAIARLKDGETWYYIDQNGKRMPLSRHYSAMVPLITGKVNDQSIGYICQLLLKTTNDPFFEGYIQGIQINNNQSLIVFPSFGNHHVIWGLPTKTDLKLNKLKAFYTLMENEDNVASIKTLNVRYEGQVVFTNY